MKKFEETPIVDEGGCGTVQIFKACGVKRNVRNRCDLESLSTSDLVAVHNHFSGSPVRRFSSHAVAVEKTEAVLKDYFMGKYR